MGNGWKKLLKKFGDREVRVLMVGLDAAGKTSLLYRMKLGEMVTTIPSIGFNVETISHGKTKFVTWDIGGRDKIRPLWRHYYQNTEALLFVVDSTDHERIAECKEELWRFLKEDELKDAVVLVMANKQDLPNAMSPTEVAEKLEVQKLDRTIYVQGTSAGTGEGLQQSLSWVQDVLIKQELKSSLVEPVKESLPKIDNKQTHSHTWWSIISNYFHSTPTLSS